MEILRRMNGGIGNHPESDKQLLGSLAEPSTGLTVPCQYREISYGSVSEPVSTIPAPLTGSEMERLYNHSQQNFYTCRVTPCNCRPETGTGSLTVAQRL